MINVWKNWRAKFNMICTFHTVQNTSGLWGTRKKVELREGGNSSKAQALSKILIRRLWRAQQADSLRTPLIRIFFYEKEPRRSAIKDEKNPIFSAA